MVSTQNRSSLKLKVYFNTNTFRACFYVNNYLELSIYCKTKYKNVYLNPLDKSYYMTSNTILSLQCKGK